MCDLKAAVEVSSLREKEIEFSLTSSSGDSS